MYARRILGGQGCALAASLFDSTARGYKLYVMVVQVRTCFKSSKMHKDKKQDIELAEWAYGWILWENAGIPLVWVVGSSIIKRAFPVTRRRPGGASLGLQTHLWWQGYSDLTLKKTQKKLVTLSQVADPPAYLMLQAFSRGCTLEERFEKLPIFDKPVCLIYTDSCGKLAVSENVLSQINLIDVPLNVVAVCGLYRTGKSYLMNRLAGERKGFSLGATTKSHTKGIWAWCKVHPTQDGQILLLLDTEGLADIRKGNTNHDNHLFGLSLLLSSTMIYNMTGVFNQEALEKLTFITKLSQDVQVMSDHRKGETNDSLIRAISPFFILCLRDFFLDIEVEDEDKQPSPDEYFEQCLEDDSHPGCKSYNKTRECIKKYFPNRKCFTLSQPALKKKLKMIDELDDNELDEDFVSEMDEMRDFVYERKHKYLDAVTNVSVNGSVFASITSTYVETLREGSSLTYQDAFAQVAQHHNSNLARKAYQEFNKEMDALKLPVKRKVVLLDTYGYQQNKTITKFREEAYPYCLEDFEDQIMEKIQSKWTEIENKNSVEVRTVCNDTLKKLYLDIVDSHRRSYKSKDGFDMYKRQMGILEKTYNTSMDEYDNDEILLGLTSRRDNYRSFGDFPSGHIPSRLSPRDNDNRSFTSEQEALSNTLVDNRIKEDVPCRLCIATKTCVDGVQ